MGRPSTAGSTSTPWPSRSTRLSAAAAVRGRRQDKGPGPPHDQAPAAPSDLCSDRRRLSGTVLRGWPRTRYRYPTCAAFAAAVVAAIGGSAAVAPQKVRFKCGACGRALASRRGLRQIKQSGRPVPCPRARARSTRRAGARSHPDVGADRPPGRDHDRHRPGGRANRPDPGADRGALPKTLGRAVRAETVVERAVAPTKTVMLGGCR